MLFPNGSILKMSVHLRTSVKGPNIFNSTVDASNVTVSPGGNSYSRVFYITLSVPGKYFVLLNFNACFGRPFKCVYHSYEERTELYPSEISPVNIVKKCPDPLMSYQYYSLTTNKPCRFSMRVGHVLHNYLEGDYVALY